MLSSHGILIGAGVKHAKFFAGLVSSAATFVFGASDNGNECDDCEKFLHATILSINFVELKGAVSQKANAARRCPFF